MRLLAARRIAPLISAALLAGCATTTMGPPEPVPGYLEAAELQSLAAAVPTPSAPGSPEQLRDETLSQRLRALEDTDRWWMATAHAELQAIRAASKLLESPRLDGCTIYASGHPCPMCLAAMHLTGIRDVAYAYSNEDGEPYGLSTAAIYAQLAQPLPSQSLKIAYLPARPDGEEDLYKMWKSAAGG